MASRGKYKRLTDLYVDGTEYVLRDGTVMWLQIPNPFEYDEARHDAAVARSRLTLALKTHGTDEMTKVRGTFLQNGKAGAIEIMTGAKASDFLMKAYDDIRADPDWRERADIIDRGEEILGRAPEDTERTYLLEMGEEYSREMGKRILDQQEALAEHLGILSEEDLWSEFQTFYLDRRGGELGLVEYKLTELWYACRCCDGVRGEDGTWDHGQCDGHQVKVFEDKADVRALPSDLQSSLSDALQDITLAERAAKDSARQGSSSVSSPLPSEGAASTPSTPAVIPDVVPGPSTSPSVTDSWSSAGAN